jgi:hypothetical protein
MIQAPGEIEMIVEKMNFYRMLGFEGRAVVHSEAAFNPGKVRSYFSFHFAFAKRADGGLFKIKSLKHNPRQA